MGARGGRPARCIAIHPDGLCPILRWLADVALNRVMPCLLRVSGKRYIKTEVFGTVQIREENAAAALEAHRHARVARDVREDRCAV